MTKKSQLAEFLAQFSEEILIADGLDYAFIGLANTANGYVCVYSTERIVSHLMEEDMMDFDTAEEYMHHNIIGAYVGELTPIFVDIIPIEFWKTD